MMSDTARLVALDQAHVWHPFTPMRQWSQSAPLVIERGEGPWLIDTDGRRHIDGVSSLWCNVHGHCVPAIDRAIRDQLDRIAHTTLLGLASVPSIELAARLCALVPRGLSRVFYSDAGATALEAAFKMAVGYWHHLGQPRRTRFIGLREAYHGDTVGAMSVGFSDLFHKPFVSMVFPVTSFANPDACRPPEGLKSSSPKSDRWPSEDLALADSLLAHCLSDLDRLLQQQGDDTAAVVIEPVMQGAAGMICQPAGFVRGVRELCDRHSVLMIADEVAVGFGRTGRMFACEHDGVTPDILCLAKGITGGYLPLAATLATDAVFDAFCGEPHERRTLYHGHTYTGNPLACAAAMASLDLFEQTNLLDHINASAAIIADRLGELRDHPHVLDVRQRGVMVGIELCRDRATAEPFDFSKRTGAALCMSMREQGLIVRPLGDVIVLMPVPAMPHDVLHRMLDIVVGTLRGWSFS
jgi:adenosylmethionine-8-amino-7-oxononanoate transaminase